MYFESLFLIHHWKRSAKRLGRDSYNDVVTKRFMYRTWGQHCKNQPEEGNHHHGKGSQGYEGEAMEEHKRLINIFYPP